MLGDFCEFSPAALSTQEHKTCSTSEMTRLADRNDFVASIYWPNALCPGAPGSKTHRTRSWKAHSLNLHRHRLQPKKNIHFTYFCRTSGQSEGTDASQSARLEAHPFQQENYSSGELEQSIQENRSRRLHHGARDRFTQQQNIFTQKQRASQRDGHAR